MRIAKGAVLGVLVFVATAFACVAVGADAYIQWDGNPAQPLAFINNPGGGFEPPHLWYGSFNDLAAGYPDTLHAVIFGGPFAEPDGQLIRVWLEFKVQNTSSDWWNDFHIVIGDGGAEYIKSGTTPPGWSTFVDINRYDYYADPGSEIGPGGFFTAGIVMEVTPIPPDNQGSCEIWLSPSVPEPAALGAMLVGLGGVVAGIRYRKLRK